MKNENITTMNVSLTEKLKDHVQERVAEGNYTSASDYVRDLIRVDIQRRIATHEQDKLILERLNQAKQGGPFIAHEDVKAYFEAKARGEKPNTPQATIQK